MLLSAKHTCWESSQPFGGEILLTMLTVTLDNLGKTTRFSQLFEQLGKKQAFNDFSGS